MEALKSVDKNMKNFHKQGAFLTSKNGEIINTMTISWGNLGLAWGKPVFIIYVRKSRFTHDIIDKSGEFTISLPLDNSMKKPLGVCGSKSGRDVDKFQLAGINTKPSNKLKSPVIDGCDVYFECKVVYKHNISPEIISEDINKSTYLEGDYHTVFYGEVIDYYVGDK
ncbi:flavin reductase family protein [Clostridium sp. MSJ-4]|uniref:Flavin reductase family protein n=1 Tax=Clostridium simiarum TaxID=2841506 RepID=A0ABS6EYZ2_9CLOT|nr:MULTISPECIES: flavin reductase family protein [Clostridium]MBU5590960.1 flavin reductase family protein [Clostridium simiarum]